MAGKNFRRRIIMLGIGFAVALGGFGCATPPPAEQGRRYLENKDFESARKIFEPLAEKDNGEAQYYLGSMYYAGYGVAQSYPEAAKWYLRSAQQNYPAAQYNLSQMYHEGQGVTPDEQKSIEWLTKAAQNGVALAQVNLAARYFSGQGMKQDYGNAILWLTKAADQGQPEAQRRLAFIYTNGIGTAQNLDKAMEMYRKAAAQDDAFSQFAVAAEEMLYGDCKTGLRLLGKSANNGYVMAEVACMVTLAAKKKTEKADQWFNHIRERNILAVSYLNRARKLGEELQNCSDIRERCRRTLQFLTTLQADELLDKKQYQLMQPPIIYRR